ncbi:MAG: serine O-acetyltransferase, partial [Hymenobacter sp.]
VVGAGAVVVRDLPAGITAVGVPAKQVAVSNER